MPRCLLYDPARQPCAHQEMRKGLFCHHLRRYIAIIGSPPCPCNSKMPVSYQTKLDMLRKKLLQLVKTVFPFHAAAWKASSEPIRYMLQEPNENTKNKLTAVWKDSTEAQLSSISLTVSPSSDTSFLTHSCTYQSIGRALRRSNCNFFYMAHLSPFVYIRPINGGSDLVQCATICYGLDCDLGATSCCTETAR